MKTSDRKTLNAIMNHKEYFDRRLIDIASGSEKIIRDLKAELERSSERIAMLEGKVRFYKEQAESKDKEIQKIRTFYMSKLEDQDELKEYIKEIERKLKELEEENKRSIQEISELVEENKKYKERIDKKIRKLQSSNSTNSNLGTSHDILSHTVSKANANTRVKSGLKRGGQKGHEAHRSVLSKSPDKIVVKHVVQAPTGAACATDEEGKVYYYTQESDFVMKPYIVETRYYIEADGKKLDDSTKSKYAINPSSYSAHFKASVVYLNQRGTIPYQRLCDMIEEISDGKIQVKPSTIVKWNDKVHENTLEKRKEILSDVLTGEIAHVDETGAKAGGKKGWIHTITNENGSYFVFTDKRGDTESGPIVLLDGYEGIVVHDHFKRIRN